MEHTEKRFFRLECPLENLNVLSQVFDPQHYFQITIYDSPGAHYFIFTRDADFVIARGFAKVNHFPYENISRDDFNRLNPPAGQYLMNGAAALSPWPGKLIPGTSF